MKLAQEIAAFATTNDGVILIGVDDGGSVRGSEDPLDRIEGILDLVEPFPTATVNSVRFRGKTVFLVEVSRGPEPVYYVGNTPYIRRGSRSRPASPEEVKKLITGEGTN